MMARVGGGDPAPVKTFRSTAILKLWFRIRTDPRRGRGIGGGTSPRDSSEPPSTATPPQSL